MDAVPALHRLITHTLSCFTRESDVALVLGLLEVLDNSPAKIGGLKADEDVILGSEKLTFRSEYPWNF